MNEYKCPLLYSSIVTGTVCYVEKALSMYAQTTFVLYHACLSNIHTLGYSEWIKHRALYSDLNM